MTTGPQVVPDLLRDRVTDDRDGLALVVHGGPVLRYGEWERRSNAVARGLVARGVAGGDRVALLFDNEWWTDYAICYIAVHKAGAVAVPLTTRFAEAEMLHVLQHCDPAGVVCPPELSEGAPAGPWWRAAVTEVEAPQAPEEARASPAICHGEDLAEILYTSGTTGTPKGVACSHANVLFHELPADVGKVDAPASLSFLHAFPIGTNAGQEVLRLPLRRAGRTSVVLPRFDPEELAAAVVEHGITRLQLVPAMAQMLLTSKVHQRHDLSSIERVTISSAPMPPTLLPGLGGAFPSALLCNAYALTESGTARTLMVDAHVRPGSVGLPVGGTEVRIAGDDGAAVAAGGIGEIWLRRPGAPLRSYYRDAEATAAALAPGGWLRTGDLGHLDESGYLYIDDRKKDVIISGGANVASLEVEHVLYEHVAVVDVAVFGAPHPVLGQIVAAAVVARAPVSARALQVFVRDRLAEHKVPHRVFFVDHLPRSASGKVLKRELPVLVGSAGAEATTSADAVVPPVGTVLDPAVADIWREVLGTAVADVDADFFSLGGHSLAATQVAARLNDRFDIDLPATVVFEHPTLRELAASVEEAKGQAR